MRGKPPTRLRILTALRPEPNWDDVTEDQLPAIRAAGNRARRSFLSKPAVGRTDRGARISDQPVDLAGRRLTVRLYQPELPASATLPLVIAFHGGGLISGAPDQDDWLLSHLSARCQAVVASVGYRLAPEHQLPAQVDDAYDAARRLSELAPTWHADPARIVVLGSSAGATLAALTALAADDLGVAVRAQILINPQLDWTNHAFAYPSFTENADSPTATPANCRAAQRLALPAALDARTVSPLHRDIGRPGAPALIQAAGLDPLEDQATAYADRLRQAGGQVRLTRYPDAVHSFLSMPGLVPAARSARAEILDYLRQQVSDAGSTGSAARRAAGRSAR